MERKVPNAALSPLVLPGFLRCLPGALRSGRGCVLPWYHADPGSVRSGLLACRLATIAQGELQFASVRARQGVAHHVLRGMD